MDPRFAGEDSQGELPVLLLETALGKQKTPLEQRVGETWQNPATIRVVFPWRFRNLTPQKV